MDDTQSPACQDQARRVHEEVSKLVLLLDDAGPQQHLNTAAHVRKTCDHLLAASLVGGMARARNDGWGLRRIAAASYYSHEQVRTILAAATSSSSQEAVDDGPVPHS